ncbi:hypothetical protein GIB67_023224 [Kingdonia uniflora]|uniref:DUF4283 domain-containing protein n=1 Tax=Kingdonia uniflora TaxID=39325 RepID=A0A7J7L952_9MAGN|nr:hypothetical protein GIB67_023224 [Kingdonia uniflora]
MADLNSLRGNNGESTEIVVREEDALEHSEGSSNPDVWAGSLNKEGQVTENTNAGKVGLESSKQHSTVDVEVMREGDDYFACMVQCLNNCNSFCNIKDRVVEMHFKCKCRQLTMSVQGLGYYFLKFSSSAEKEKALELGHLHIASRIFFIGEWRPFIEYEPKETTSLPLWVMFHNLSNQCWNKEDLGQIGSLIGKLLYTDKATEKRSRSFARICIEVDMHDKFLTKW